MNLYKAKTLIMALTRGDINGYFRTAGSGSWFVFGKYFFFDKTLPAHNDTPRKDNSLQRMTMRQNLPLLWH